MLERIDLRHVLVVSCLAGLLALAPQASAAEFTVNSTADTTECAATCTLRGAIAEADKSADPSNTIVVPAGAYELSLADKADPTHTGELRIANPAGTTLTIKGAGAGVTVLDAAASHDRAIHMEGGGSDVLEGLTIEKGFQHEDEAFSPEENDRGAGIYQFGGELTLDHVRLTGNIDNGYGGGVDVEDKGTLNIFDSEFDRDIANNVGGGAVDLEGGTLSVIDTTFDHDSSGTGSGGAVRLINGHSSFVNDTFADDGVEFGATYEGGGAYVEGGSVTFTNVTFAGDVAAGGKGGGSDINASEGARVSLTNVLLGPTQEDPLDQACAGNAVGVAGEWQDLGGNLSTEEVCALAPADMGIVVGFGELGNYGGATPTVPLMQGSPAIDFGVTGCPATDQRGYARVGTCDSGAFEFGGAPPRTGESGGGPTTNTEASTSTTTSTPPATTTVPASGIASTPQAIEELLLGCSKRSLVLNDVLISGTRVVLNGSAAKSLVGKKVKILFEDSKQVAVATVQSDGQFSTTAPLPPARLRRGNSARYMAESGREHSLNLKLTRRLILQSPTFSGAAVTLTGQVVAPLGKPVGGVTVEQQLECGKSAKVLTFTPPANGRFHVTISGIPANAKAGVYRLTTSVLNSPHSHRTFPTFSLPLPVALG
jgi:CSLREA domain-containing protein